MNREKESRAAEWQKKPLWSVVVFFEDIETRQRAVAFCEQLIHRYWGQCGFEVCWLSSDVLEDGSSASEASLKAVEADLIIYSLRPGDHVALTLRAWVENWLKCRGEREGAIVGLGEPSPTTATFMFLRDAAHRAGMDYLTEVPQAFQRAIPNSLDSFAARAETVTTVLNEILRKQSPSPVVLLP